METHNWQRWFVSGSYTPAGRPKLEDELMRYARGVYLHTLIYETDLPNLVKQIQVKQEQIWEANKRLRKVEVKLGRDWYSIVPTRWLYIGEQHLVLTKVKDEKETIDPNFPVRYDG